MNLKMIGLAGSLMLLEAAGPLEGFFKGPPVESTSSLPSGEIERCLIEKVAATPFVYRQPDRPAFVTLVWNHQFTKPANPVARIELEQTLAHTIVRAWKDGEKIVRQFPECFGPS